MAATAQAPCLVENNGCACNCTYLFQDVCCCKAREGYCDVETCAEGENPWAAHGRKNGLCSVQAGRATFLDLEWECGGHEAENGYAR